MHVLYVHKNFPAQFGHIAERLICDYGYRTSFLTEQAAGEAGQIHRILYTRSGAATHAAHAACREFEDFTWRGHAVLEALRHRGDIRPDVIVGHSGFGSTLFLRDFFDCPIVNMCEWFYRFEGSDSELLQHRGGPNGMNRLTDRCRNAALLADLNACTLGYCPMNWQMSRIPDEYQYKLETVFDGIDTSFWRPLRWRERIPRSIAGKWIPRWKKVITYVSRGFESMRGFDVFMRIAQRLSERRKDVVFLCIGSDRVCYSGDMKRIQEDSFSEHVLNSGRYDLDRFIFTGPIPREELRRAFAYSDLHIYLTVPFILSWSLMDALACGCTVLVADTPPLREVIEHGKNGLMAPYFDVDHFVELALEVLDDPAAYRRTLGQAGLETIHEKYDLDIVLPRMINLYERAINGDVPRLGENNGCLGSRRQASPQTVPLGAALRSDPSHPQPVEKRGRVSFFAAKKETRPLGWLSTAEVTSLRAESSRRLHGPGTNTRERRVEAVGACLSALLETFGRHAYVRDKGTGTICSADSANLSQSPMVLGESQTRRTVRPVNLYGRAPLCAARCAGHSVPAFNRSVWHLPRNPAWCDDLV